MKKSKDKKSGITLIALVISIIVLLILAGISIAMLSENNSIFTRSKQALAYNHIGAVKDEVSSAYTAAFAEYIANQYNNSITDANKKDLAKLMAKEVKNYVAANGAKSHECVVEYDENGVETVTISYTNDRGKTYSVIGTLNTTTGKEMFAWGGIQEVKAKATVLDEKIVTNENGTGTEAEGNQEEGTKLYISFKVSISEGTIQSVTCDKGTPSKKGELWVTEITANGTYKFTITDGENNTTTYSVTVSKYALRAGIKVGEYITYTSPTESVTFDEADTGNANYNSNTGTPKTLTRKTLFRVMNINEDGSMDLLGVVISSDPTIYFSGAVGYNNAVYTLNEKCSELYANTAKGITARSVKLEDITDKMIEGTEGETYDTSTGKKKLSKYVSTQVAGLTPGTYISEVDKTKNTVTYKRNRGYYPDIFKYEVGGILDGTATTGTIGGSETYRGQTEPTTATYTQVTNEDTGTLTVPYTYYNTSHNANNFDNTEGNASTWNNMFFGTRTYYWLASRCVRCYSHNAGFSLRYVNGSRFDANYLFDSYHSTNSGDYRICPVVSLSPSVQVTKCTGKNSSTNPHTVVVSN